VAVRVEEKVRGLDVAVDQVGRVHVEKSLQELVDYVLLVHFFKDACANDGV